MLLDGKVALVTGAGRGLGRGHARALAAAGARVVVNDLGGASSGEGSDPAPAQAVVDEIRAAGGEAVADGRSVADWNSARAIVDAAIEHFGRLDIVVNNAGIGHGTPFGTMEERDWDLAININLKGTAAITHWAARHWRETGPHAGRALINTSSPAGPHPFPTASGYGAAKAGVAALTQAAAIELADLGVRANAITPIARTRMVEGTPDLLALLVADEKFDRYLPERAAPLVVYLASPLCKFTGRLFGIEGDDVYLWGEWSAEHHANNHGAQWTPAQLAEALEPFPAQDRRWMLQPGGRIENLSPPDETLDALKRGDALKRV